MPTLVTGGTGWVASNLLPKLDQPIIVSRNQQSAVNTTGLPVEQVIECDATNELVPITDSMNIESVVNLMGASIADGRWNEKRKQLIRDSRVQGTANLVKSILKLEYRPSVFISASAIGFYGDRGDEVLDESSTPGDDFLADVSVQWEKATMPLVDAGVRVVLLRIGIVLGKGGGAMEKMMTPFKLGVGGRLGSGKQFMSWIHMDDLVNLILFAKNNSSIVGPINATAPNPVRNSRFTKELGKALHRPTIIPVPEFALRAALGEFATFLTASTNVVPKSAMDNGFPFQYPELGSAFMEIVG